MENYFFYSKGLRQNQLSWLNDQLNHCQKHNKKAIICGHVPIHKRAATSKHVPFNNEEILELIHSYENVCVAYFAGHYHCGGFYEDKQNKIVHITFPAVLETQPGSPCFSTIMVYGDFLIVESNRYQTQRIRIGL